MLWDELLQQELLFAHESFSVRQLQHRLWGLDVIGLLELLRFHDDHNLLRLSCLGLRQLQPMHL